MSEKDLCRQNTIFVPRALGMQKQSGSCSFICCSGMSTEMTSWAVEPKYERCNSSKESGLQGVVSEQSQLFFAFMLRCENLQPSQWKSPKCNFGRFLGINWIPVTGKPSSFQKIFLCKIQRRPKWCTQQQVGQSLQMEAVFQRYFKPCHYCTIRHTGVAFAEGKCHHCSQSLPICQNTGCCNEIWPIMLKALNWEVFLIGSCVSSGPGVLGGH